MSATAKRGLLAPRDEYARRRAEREEARQTLDRREPTGGLARVVTFLSIPGVLFAASYRGGYAYLWAIVALAAFGVAIAWHRRLVAALRRARRAIDHYADGLARLDDRWPEGGATGERYRRPEHPYAGDLDLFGRESLFQRLCAARTPVGQDTLAAWLLSPAEPETIRARHAAIDELRGQLDLREQLAVIETPLDRQLHPDKLLAWASGPAMLSDRLRPAVAIVLAPVSLAMLVAWIGFGMAFWPFLGIAMCQAILLFSMRRQIRSLSRHIESAVGELALLLEVLRILEKQQFATPQLKDLVARLNSAGHAPSVRIARLTRLLDYWDTVWRNQFVAPIAFIFMLHLHLAYSIERWRRRHGPSVCHWLESVGQFEALLSLAGYAYEHPEQPLPEIDESGHRFEAEGLGHPLIPAGRRVSNELTLDDDHRLLLVSGSNMSGKSTLLRSVGVNAVLALAGAPVCAKRLRISPQTIATVMRTADSLQAGVSGFYAELTRLRAVFDLAGGRLPVLFLLDEILHGTNSQDRRAGAEAVIGGLLQRGAIGIATTHDLALAEIAERIKPRAANVHFEDQVVDGRIRFDYRLRPGVVPKGNGLVLMRLLGFEV
jgi:hypothetical protein